MAVQSARPDTRVNIRLMSDLRNVERPKWTQDGSLIKRTTKKHYLPRHPYYYTSKELFECPAVEEKTMSTREVENYIDSLTRTDARRAFSAPHQVKKIEPKSLPASPSSRASFEKRRSSAGTKEIPPTSGSSSLRRPKTNSSSISYRKLFPESVAWSVTPLPGLRVLQEKDYYRKKAIAMKNTDIFLIDSGIIPKYMGYVPGLKFRYGGTFANMTYNAKEMGVGLSSTWGGAVSLF